MLIGNPRTNDPPKPMPANPGPQEPEPEPEPSQLDERELAEIAEQDARFFLATNYERIHERAWDLARPQRASSKDYDKVYKEELGFGLFFIMEVLLPILEEEKPAEKELGIFISEPFIVEYTILKFQHPDKNEDELLELFRASAREGNISIIPGQQKPLLNLGQQKVEPNQQGCVPKEWIGNKWLEDFLQSDLPEDPDPNLSNLDKARVLFKKYQKIREELFEQSPNMDFNVAIDRAAKEVFGKNGATEEILFNTYWEETGYLWFSRRLYAPGPVLEYFRLSFEFPNEDTEGLLCLFRESVRAGNVSAFADNPKPTLEPMMPAPEPPAVEDADFLEQARALVSEVEAQTSELSDKMRAEGKGWEEINEARNAIQRREWGFDWDFVENKLLTIHREENPRDVVGEHFVFIAEPLMIEYLRLSLEHPEKGEEELLELFRQSSRDGNISINPNNPRPAPDWWEKR